MKFLAVLLALFLLTGCTGPKVENLPPTESTQALYAPGHTLETQTQGVIQVFPTQETGFCHIHPMGEDLLLQCGGNITRLSGPGLQETAQGSTQVVLRTDADGAWVLTSHTVSVLDGDLQELQTISLPDTLSGIPGLSPDSRYLYYLDQECLKVLDCSTGLSSLLRDNMHFYDGSVTALNQELLFLRLTREDGSPQRLLVSAQDGSTQYQDYAPQDAAWSQAGLQMLLPDAGAPLVLLLTPGGTAGQLPLGPTEEVLCFLDGFVITQTPTTTGLTLRLYSFSSRMLLSQVELPGMDALGNGCFTGDGSLYLTARHQDTGLWWILRWNYDAFPPENTDSCLVPYYTRQNPNRAGMAQCRETADGLEEQYGISILLFDQAAQAAPWDYRFTAAYRVEETQWQLQCLDEALATFPQGFLSKLRKGWDDLTLCLVSAIEGTAGSGSLDTAEGLQFQSGSHFYLALAPSSPESLRYTLFHEFSHLIDTQVLTRCSVYDNWNDLNPQDFAYALDYQVDLEAYGSFLEGDDRAFIDAYSMTYPAEDRARIFECATNPGNEALFTSPILKAKLLRICTGIRQAFNLTQEGGPYVWEQYLGQGAGKG